MNRFRLWILAFALGLAPAAAEARTLALLVGVADYNEPSGIHDLLGPRNDVAILWRALLGRGVPGTDITVLTDHLPEGETFPVPNGLPENANILNELDSLAARATRGDTVLFYYSGHGTRQPDNPAEPEDEPEADGMDQVLLPADVGAYDPIRMTLKNAIVDDELGRKLKAIRATGATVWAVIDACHSGTVTRGDTVTRSVDPVKLGIPAAAPAQASRGGTREGTLMASAAPGEGALIGFYAVDSYDEAIERPFPGYDMPMVGADQEQRMGVFTYLLHRALARRTASTFRDLAQEMMAELNTDATGGKVPPPVFDGDLDAAVPGSDAARLPLSATGLLSEGSLKLPVGTLQGFDVGAVLELYRPGEPDAPVARADVTEATAVTATAANITWRAGSDAIVNGTLAAVVAEPSVSFRFVVAPPPSSDLAEQAALAEPLRTVLEAALGQGAEAIGLALGESGDPDADVLLRVKAGRLWIVRPDRPWVTTAGAFDETPSLVLDAPPEKIAARLKDALWSLARAAKLVRVATALAADGGGEAEGLSVKGSLMRSPTPDARAACKTNAVPDLAGAAAVDPLLPAAAGNCDFVAIEVSNDTDQDYYVAGFYVDSLGGVAAIPTSVAKTGCVRPLPAGTGKVLNFKFWIDTWDEKAGRPSSTGAENFVIIATPKEGGAAPRLCALTQPTLAGMQQTRDVEAGQTRGSRSTLGRLMDGMQGSATRGASTAPDEEGPRLAGSLFVFDVKP